MDAASEPLLSDITQNQGVFVNFVNIIKIVKERLGYCMASLMGDWWKDANSSTEENQEKSPTKATCVGSIILFIFVSFLVAVDAYLHPDPGDIDAHRKKCDGLSSDVIDEADESVAKEEQDGSKSGAGVGLVADGSEETVEEAVEAGAAGDGSPPAQEEPEDIDAHRKKSDDPAPDVIDKADHNGAKEKQDVSTEHQAGDVDPGGSGGSGDGCPPAQDSGVSIVKGDAQESPRIISG